MGFNKKQRARVTHSFTLYSHGIHTLFHTVTAHYLTHCCSDLNLTIIYLTFFE